MEVRPPHQERPFPMFSLSLPRAIFFRPSAQAAGARAGRGRSATVPTIAPSPRSGGRGGAQYIIAAACLTRALASQNGSIGISGIFLQAKLMMMMMMAELTAAQRCLQSAVAVRSDRVEKEGKDRCLQYRFFRSPFFPRPHYQARSRLWEGNCSVARASAKEC